MTELEMYKYLFDAETGLNPEMRWHDDELLIFLYYFEIEDFMKEVGEPSGAFEDGGLTGYLQPRHICVDLVPILEAYDINPESILKKEKH